MTNEKTVKELQHEQDRYLEDVKRFNREELPTFALVAITYARHLQHKILYLKGYNND